MQSYLFHISSDGSLSEMLPQAYDNEDHIQRLLAEHPAILGGRYRGQEPRRWALIQREVPVPDGATSDRRWSLDHLYVDQDAIPTLVEVKRSRDTRSRREVVGQMFDYAANGPSYWSIGELRAAFTHTHNKGNADPAAALRGLLGDELDVEAFWSLVEENLRSGRIRMIFLVDEMPAELLRIVEFLATQLRTAEVYAVEVKQHVGFSGQVLATSILGQAQNDVQKLTGARSTIRQSEQGWFDGFRERHGAVAEGIARSVAEWAQGRGLSAFVTSAQTPSMGWSVNEAGIARYPLFIAGNGKIYTSLDYLAKSPTFTTDEARQGLADRFRATEIPFSISSLKGDIRIPIMELREERVLKRYLAAIEYILTQLHSHDGSQPESGGA